MDVPAFVIAGTHSGVGKTTISIALMAALRRRGLRVQPFKVGPDFIDAAFHTRAAGRTSRNVDGWMLGRDANAAVFAGATLDADIAVIEGVMGLFDGRDALTEAGSTAEMSKQLNAPVVLVVDASAMARSAAALVHGYESFDDALNVAGVVFNRVAGAGHFAYLRDAVEGSCRARVLGWLPRDENIALPERHLGLVMPDEVLDPPRLDAMVTWIEAGLDIKALIDIAGMRSRTETHTGELPHESSILRKDGMRAIDDEAENEEPLAIEGETSQASFARARRPRIGIAREHAFCFYYQDNLDLLVRYGAELIEFSPLADRQLPEALDGLYFGGGYPELYAAALAANERMRADVARFAQKGKPIYAECGGLMYLTEAIVDVEGREHSMVGVFPTRARMQPRRAALGYTEVEGVDDAGWLRSNERARGHEFRYSVIDEMPEHIVRRYRVSAKSGERYEGFAIGAVLASYVHLHFGSCPRMAARLVAACGRSLTDFR